VRLQIGGELPSLAFAEVAAIRDASGDREAPVLRNHGELGSRDDVPHDVGAADIGVRAITPVVREVEDSRRELARVAHAFERRAQPLRGSRILDHLRDGTALREHLHFAVSGLKYVAAGEGNHEQSGEREPRSRDGPSPGS
jgi:hypothetical protein